MEKIINWLLQSTSDGSTYLQVIIISTLLCLFLYLLFTDFEKIVEEVNEEERNLKNEIHKEEM